MATTGRHRFPLLGLFSRERSHRNADGQRPEDRGELIAQILDEDLETNGTETTIELNFAVLKFKHTIKKQKD